MFKKLIHINYRINNNKKASYKSKRVVEEVNYTHTTVRAGLSTKLGTIKAITERLNTLSHISTLPINTSSYLNICLLLFANKVMLIKYFKNKVNYKI